jgi:selenocysteine lyase/cysteine desulfurase
MTPEDLRADIPAFEDGIYFNTGASGPAPNRVIDAATEFQRYQESDALTGGEGAYGSAYRVFDETREAVSGFVGAEKEEIALTQSTADGVSTVAAAIDWEPGDVVVRTDVEHSAGIIPWWNLREQGVEVEVLETTDGRIDMDDLAEAVDGARLLCLSSITWNYGTELPLSDIVDVANDAGAEVLVDAVQTPGQKPMDVKEWGAEYVVGAGHKWMIGPWGAGFLYVERDVAESMTPAQASYRSVADSGADELELGPGATRFEVGTTSPAPYVGLQESIGIFDEVGFDTVTDRIERLTDRLKAGLGERCLSPDGYESGLVTFSSDDPEATVEHLADHGVHIRTLPYPEACRVSVHVFNTADDVDALLDALDDE